MQNKSTLTGREMLQKLCVAIEGRGVQLLDESKTLTTPEAQKLAASFAGRLANLGKDAQECLGKFEAEYQRLVDDLVAMRGLTGK